MRQVTILALTLVFGIEAPAYAQSSTPFLNWSTGDEGQRVEVLSKAHENIYVSVCVDRASLSIAHLWVDKQSDPSTTGGQDIKQGDCVVRAVDMEQRVNLRTAQVDKKAHGTFAVHY